jgi:hypothetical protein
MSGKILSIKPMPPGARVRTPISPRYIHPGNAAPTRSCSHNKARSVSLQFLYGKKMGKTPARTALSGDVASAIAVPVSQQNSAIPTLNELLFLS